MDFGAPLQMWEQYSKEGQIHILIALLLIISSLHFNSNKILLDNSAFLY